MKPKTKILKKKVYVCPICGQDRDDLFYTCKICGTPHCYYCRSEFLIGSYKNKWNIDLCKKCNDLELLQKVFKKFEPIREKICKEIIVELKKAKKEEANLKRKRLKSEIGLRKKNLKMLESMVKKEVKKV